MAWLTSPEAKPAAAWPAWPYIPGSGILTGAAADSAPNDQCSHSCPAPSSPASIGKDRRKRVRTATGIIATAHNAVTIAGSGSRPPPARWPPAASATMMDPTSPVRNSRKEARVIVSSPFRIPWAGWLSLKSLESVRAIVHPHAPTTRATGTNVPE